MEKKNEKNLLDSSEFSKESVSCIPSTKVLEVLTAWEIIRDSFTEVFNQKLSRVIPQFLRGKFNIVIDHAGTHSNMVRFAMTARLCDASDKEENYVNITGVGSVIEVTEHHDPVHFISNGLVELFHNTFCNNLMLSGALKEYHDHKT